MDFNILAGDTNKTIYIRLRDATTGIAKPGLVYNSAGAVCSYTLPLAARVAITLATQTVTGAHSDGGFVEVDGVNCKGLYRLDLPDAAIASGAFSIISIEFDGIIEESIQIELHTRKVTLVATGLDAIVSTATGMVEIAKAIWDRVLTGATHNIATSAGRRLRGIQDFGNYLGSIHIDTVNGTAGTVVDENGTTDNPVDNLADAIALNATLGYNQFTLWPSSSITLDQTFSNFVFDGKNGWTLAFGGQDISGSTIRGATVTGIGTGTSEIKLENCTFGVCTLDPFHAEFCGLAGTVTIGKAGNYVLGHCHSEVAGSTAPIIDTGAAIANVNLAMPGYYNGIEISNLNATGADEYSLSGVGQVIYSASSSGTVNQRGDWKVTNTGGVTIVADDNTTNIAAIPTTAMRGTDDALLATSAPTNFSSMVITAGGAVDSLIQGFLNTLLTEVTAGRIAGNFDVFYENADALTVQTVDNVGSSGNVTVGDITAAALAKFMSTDSGETTAVAGSVAKIAQGAAGGNVTVEALTQAALDDMWANASRTLTQTAASITTALSGSRITIHRGDSFSVTLTGLGSLLGRSKLWFTLKVNANETDAHAVIQIEETDNLIVQNGAAPGDATKGGITVDDENAGDITITLDESVTSVLTPRNDLVYDVQVLIAGAVTTKTVSVADINADVTRSIV